jgi:RNA polymerase sigma-70 factor (ECF subfamily)
MSNYGNIVKGVRERNAQSQLMFYDLFIHSVYRAAFSIAGNECEAEEIAQDTMLKVFDKIDLLNDDAGIMERVLRRIASNAAIDRLRRRKEFVFSTEEIPDSEDLDDESDDYDFSVEEIKEAITSLSDVYRSVLVLRLFADMSFAEVAEMLKVNYSTVRVQYTRGIARLKDLLIKKRNYV